MYAPNFAPIFINDLEDLEINMNNVTNIKDYQLPDIFDDNNDIYTIEFENLPNFITFE